MAVAAAVEHKVKVTSKRHLHEDEEKLMYEISNENEEDKELTSFILNLLEPLSQQCLVNIRVSRFH